MLVSRGYTSQEQPRQLRRTFLAIRKSHGDNMTLLTNGSNFQAFPGKFLSAGTETLSLSNQFGDASQDMFFSEYWSSKTAIPAGGSAPFVVVTAIKEGGFSSRIAFRFNHVANALAQKDIVGTTSMVFGTSSSLDIVSFLNGTASLTFSDVADVIAVSNLEAALTMAFSTSANLAISVPLDCTITFTFDSNTVLRGIASIEVEITPFTELSPQNLANAVWSAIAASNNEVGSMGEKLNDAGSGSNPWTEVIEGGLTAADILRIILAVQAGKTTIVNTGPTTNTVTFRDLADTKNRVDADMDGSERIAVTLDGT